MVQTMCKRVEKRLRRHWEAVQGPERLLDSGAAWSFTQPDVTAHVVSSTSSPPFCRIQPAQHNPCSLVGEIPWAALLTPI